jgi:hypothetical protein
MVTVDFSQMRRADRRTAPLQMPSNTKQDQLVVYHPQCEEVHESGGCKLEAEKDCIDNISCRSNHISALSC